MIATATAYHGGPALFATGLDLAVWVIVLVKVIVVFVLLMISVLFMVMYERKAIARLGTAGGRTGRARTAGCSPWPTASSCSSRRRCFPRRATSSSTASPP